MKNVNALNPCPFCGCDMHIDTIMTRYGLGYVPKGRHEDECPLVGVGFDCWLDEDELKDSWNDRCTV